MDALLHARISHNCCLTRRSQSTNILTNTNLESTAGSYRARLHHPALSQTQRREGVIISLSLSLRGDKVQEGIRGVNVNKTNGFQLLLSIHE